MVIKTFEINSKVFSILFENNSENSIAIGYLKNYLRHILVRKKKLNISYSICLPYY